jgi:hypothetical protein
MDGWAIDSYGLRAAHRQSVLDQLRDTDRLHVSPFTWHPGDAAGTGNIGHSLGSDCDASAKLTSVGPDGRRTHIRAAGLLTARLRDLHERGVLVVVGDPQCGPQLVAEVEGSWQAAGLVSRPTNETFTSVLTADRLGVDLVTDDIDVRRLADHWQVATMTVADFASAIAA